VSEEAPRAPEAATGEGVVARALGLVSGAGAAAQSAVPALYAWGLTVAPVAWGRGGGPLARVTSVGALVAIGVAIGLERRRPDLSRPLLVWGFTAGSLLTWVLAPVGLSTAKLDATRGFLGAAGWLMFAFSAAAPPIRRAAQAGSAGRIVPGAKLLPRVRIARGDGVILALAFVCALGLQAVGWGVVVPERALLLRALTLVSGIAILGAATEVAAARHLPRKPARPSVRLSRMWPPAVLLLLLGVAAVAYGLLRGP
jgi:hypothetical protein